MCKKYATRQGSDRKGPGTSYVEVAVKRDFSYQ